jgi:uncharacterized protein YbjT (DUF2867 family)
MNTPTLIVGGTGKIGRRVASLLTQDGRPVRIASRSGEHHFDWDAPAGWRAVLQGVAVAFVVPPFGEEFGRRVAALVQQAERAGVERLVLMTGMPADLPEDRLPGYVRAERAAEHALRESRLRWTIIQPNWFMQNFTEGFMLGDVLAGEVRLPTGEGRVAWTDADDIAAVAAVALTCTDDRHDGRVYQVTGPRSMSFAEAVAAIGEATGRTVRYAAVDPRGYGDAMLAHGLPEPEVAAYLDLFAMAAAGRYDRTSSDVLRVLGRPPGDFGRFARAAADAGAWSAGQPA